MLAIQLKNYLESIPDEAIILVYVQKENEVRQLLMADLDKTHEGHIVIDAEYKVKPKLTELQNGRRN